MRRVLAEGTPVSRFGLLLITVIRMDVLMYFLADILFQVTRIHFSK